MVSLSSLLMLIHLLGLSLGVGAATVKLILLFKCNSDYGFVPAYLKVTKMITKLIILGLVLLTLSGIGWVWLVYPFTPKLIVKLIFVLAIWVIGPIIDNAIEPKFRELAPASGEQASPEFVKIQKKLLTLEIIATGLFYLIILMWILV